MASAPPGSGSKVEDESKAESLKLLKDQKDGKKKVEFKGPVEDRSCTDIPCCIIFVAYIVGMIIVGIIAFKEGDPDRLLLPSDSQGNICGKDNYVDKKYLLFFDISTCATKGGDFTKFVSVPSCPTPQVCVSECPKENELGTSRKASDMVCKEGTETITESNKFNMVKQGKCAPYYLVSQPVLYRCIPTLADNLLANNSVITNAAGGNVTKKAIELGLEGLKFLLNAQNFGMSIFEDMKAVWYWLLM